LVVKKPKFTPKHSFKTWLFTIGRNRALNALRFHSKVITTDKADVLHLQKEELNIEKAYIKKEEQILLHQCIQRLLPQYREVLYLSYFEMLTVKEIATVTKRNNKQITNLLFRAKEALKDQLLKEGFDYEEL
jgi:RNA polymerase sigma-70 factor (ECF subfamily)